MRSYVQPPEGWERISTDGPGPFVTREVFRRPDGAEVAWESRPHRKQARTAGRIAPAAPGDVWWHPQSRSWWMATLFAIGSLCFAGAAIAAQWSLAAGKAIGITFFVGSLFFTSAAYLQYSEAVNADHAIVSGRRGSRWRPASWEPSRIDWLSSLVQLVGTIFFNVSTFAAMNTDLTTQQANHRVWGPDVVGSIAFLISSELAFAEVCHRWLCIRCRGLSWRIVALNLIGSIAFGISAVASLTEPSSGQPVSARIANAGTSLGGICFLLGALLLMPESTVSATSEAKPG